MRINRTEEHNTPLLEQITVISSPREGGLYDAHVPVELINSEAVSVNETHVDELQQSMHSQLSDGRQTGQLSAVLLAHIPSHETFPIIDGFHRVEAIRALGKQTVFATINPESTWDDVYNLRIVAATSHKSVRFARIASWADEVWNRGPWGSDERLDLMQAFSLGFNQRMSGRNLNLAPEETQNIREWVSAKSEQWGIKPGTLYNYLRTARSADPRLVQEAREGKGTRGTQLTPLHVATIAHQLPGLPNYQLQSAVAEAVKYHKLTTPQTKLLATAVANASDMEEVASILGSGIKQIITPPKNGIAQQIEMRMQPTSEKMLDQLFEDELEIAVISIANVILGANCTKRVMHRLFTETLAQAHPVATDFIRSLDKTQLLMDVPDAISAASTPPLVNDALAQRVRSLLPNLERADRRALVLTTFFRLQSKFIATILNEKIEETTKRMTRTQQLLEP